MHTQRYRFFVISFLLLIFFFGYVPHTFAVGCNSLGITINHSWPTDKPYIETPIPLTVTVNGLEDNFDNEKTFVRVSSTLGYCTDVNSPLLEPVNSSKATINNFQFLEFTRFDNFYPCDVALKSESGDTICEFDYLYLPKAEITGNFQPVIGMNQPLTIWGSANYKGQVCAIKDGVTDYKNLGCAQVKPNGTFSMTVAHGLAPGTYDIEFYKEPEGVEVGEIFERPLRVTPKDQDLPEDGQIGGKCINQNNQWTCNEGIPSSQGADCICIDDNEPNFTGPITPSKICDFAGDNVAECRACIGDNQDTKKMWTALGCIRVDPQGLVEDILKVAIGIAGGIAFLMIIFGGFSCMMASGNPEKLNSCKEIITSAITGLLLVVFSTIILKIIGIDILGGFPGFGT